MLIAWCGRHREVRGASCNQIGSLAGRRSRHPCRQSRRVLIFAHRMVDSNPPLTSRTKISLIVPSSSTPRPRTNKKHHLLSSRLAALLPSSAAFLANRRHAVVVDDAAVVGIDEIVHARESLAWAGAPCRASSAASSQLLPGPGALPCCHAAGTEGMSLKTYARCHVFFARSWKNVRGGGSLDTRLDSDDESLGSSDETEERSLPSAAVGVSVRGRETPSTRPSFARAATRFFDFAHLHGRARPEDRNRTMHLADSSRPRYDDRRRSSSAATDRCSSFGA